VYRKKREKKTSGVAPTRGKTSEGNMSPGEMSYSRELTTLPGPRLVG